VRHHGAVGEKGAVEVDGDGAVPVFHGDVENGGGGAGDARAVHQDVDAAQLLHGFGSRCLY
jgi:hypothetical protein